MSPIPPLEPIKTQSLPLPSSNDPTTATTLPASPKRPKHLSTRSITEVNAPPSLPRIPRSRDGNMEGGKHHNHHHPHIHHHRRRREKERDRDGSGGTGSGVSGRGYDGSGEYGSGSGRDGIGGSRSEGHTPSESRVGSRRESFSFRERERGGGGGGNEGIRREMGRAVKEGGVREERERGVLRATELRNALNHLQTDSNLTTRRLDTTYYSVLEKLSILHSTLSSLKDLAFLTRSLTTSFSAEAQEVVDDVTGQINGFGKFKDQEKRVRDLMERVKRGKERIEKCSTRVAQVGDRVRGWEEREGEWQDRTRRRLRVLWVVASAVMVVILVVLGVQFRGLGAGEGLIGSRNGTNTTGLLGVVPDMRGLRGGNESWSLKRKGLGEDVLERLRVDEPVEEDPRLRVFDEL